MPFHYITQQPPTADAPRRTVIEDLPEIEQIGNFALRRKAIEAWDFTLSHSSFNRISDIGPGGNPGRTSCNADLRQIVCEGSKLPRRHHARA